jgi:hypothetical protein
MRLLRIVDWDLATSFLVSTTPGLVRRCPLCPPLPLDRARDGHSFELPLRRSFRGGWSAGVFLVRMGFLVEVVLLDVCRYRPVLARGWHARLIRPEAKSPRAVSGAACLNCE